MAVSGTLLALEVPDLQDIPTTYPPNRAAPVFLSSESAQSGVLKIRNALKIDHK